MKTIEETILEGALGLLDTVNDRERVQWLARNQTRFVEELHQVRSERGEAQPFIPRSLSDSIAFIAVAYSMQVHRAIRAHHVTADEMRRLSHRVALWMADDIEEPS